MFSISYFEKRKKYPQKSDNSLNYNNNINSLSIFLKKLKTLIL